MYGTRDFLAWNLGKAGPPCEGGHHKGGWLGCGRRDITQSHHVRTRNTNFGLEFRAGGLGGEQVLFSISVWQGIG